MDKYAELLNRRQSVERQIENCRNTDPDLSDELDEIDAELAFMGRVDELDNVFDLPFSYSIGDNKNGMV